ncbi:MAG: hypothetical protein JJU19_08290, partial [Pararhodobacter sp.]|nr:hypothetical protein [Pararhodobacter sp.]
DPGAAVVFPVGTPWPGGAVRDPDRRPDAVLIAVKAGDMADALQRAIDIAPGAPVVPLVNGIPFWLLPRLGRADLPGQLRAVDPDGRQTALLAALQVVGAVVQIPAARADGVVQAGANPALIIEAGGGTALDQVTGALLAGGVKVTRPADLLPDLFDKLMGNAVLNPLTALTGLSVGAAVTRLESQTCRGMEEVVSVARALGLTLTLDIAQRARRAMALTGHSTSMLQDIRSGRRTEIEQITGATVELGALLGVDTPVLSLLHGLVAAQEQDLG